jgi:hypothetical protein
MAEHPVGDQAPLHSLRAYARGKGIPEDVAVKVYEEEVQRLSKTARVKRFLSVLAEKHAKDVLREGAGA